MVRLFGIDVMQTKRCTMCKEDKLTTHFGKDTNAPTGLAYRCKECSKEYAKVYRANNKSKIAVSNKRYKQANAASVRKKDKEWRDDNKEHLKEYKAEYVKHNRGKVVALCNKRRAAKLNATPLWADKEAIDRMYIVSNFLTNKLGEPHHVDHIIPLQGKSICGLHVEYNLDVIPAKDNLRKGNRYA